MYDIKYFFSTKLIRQFRGRGQRNFQGGQITERITEKYCFSKSIVDPHLFGINVILA
jgi:hypothetical protein